MKGGISYWQAKKYPLLKHDYYENVDGVLARRWSEAHECESPGKYIPHTKESNSYPYSRPEWERGSFWTCPVCKRVMVYRQFGSTSGDRWVYMREQWWGLWRKYHQARSKVRPVKAPDLEEE